jgi:hypothetical protein
LVFILLLVFISPAVRLNSTEGGTSASLWRVTAPPEEHFTLLTSAFERAC